MNLVESIPPKVSSPFVVSRLVVGANEIPTSCASMRPCTNALSVTVGTHADVSGKRVPVCQDECDQRRSKPCQSDMCSLPHVKSTGPILGA